MSSDLEEFPEWWRWIHKHRSMSRAGYKIGHLGTKLPSPDTRADLLTVKPLTIWRKLTHVRESFIPNHRDILFAQWKFNQVAIESGCYPSVSYSYKDTERIVNVMCRIRPDDAILEEETESRRVES